MKDQKFINNSYVNQTKFGGFLLKLDVAELAKLTPFNGQYLIGINNRKDGQGFYLTEAEWAKTEAPAKPRDNGAHGYTEGYGLPPVTTDTLPF
jgi:hypothetical protein